MGSLQELDTIERLHFHFSLSHIGEGNRNPLQCSCLENSRDRGAWWAAVYGVAQSRTRLKRFSSSSSSKGPARQGRRRKTCRFNPWVGKIPWRRKWRESVWAVFLPGESHSGTEKAGRLWSTGLQRVGHD